jgi:hypothetical protein
MTRFAFLILLLSVLLSGSCTSRKKKLDRSNLIPKKELISIITDVYITDGLMAIPTIRDHYTPVDSVSSYRDVIVKHGYTKEVMDKTLKYYYIKKPKVLIQIYDQVLAALSEMETRYEREIAIMQSHALTLWTGDESYSLPDPAGGDSASFVVNTKYQGVFSFTFTATMFPDDQSVNAGLCAYVINSDSLKTGKKTYIKSDKYIKDGYPHNYRILINCSDKPKHQLRGFFYDTEGNREISESHLIIENISYLITSGAL